MDGDTSTYIFTFDTDSDLLYIGVEGLSFSQVIDSLNINSLSTEAGIFADYLEDNIEQSELRDRVISYYRGVFNGSIV
jgi:hypothetical protein